ncbi:MAG: leucine-rich repeat domain-containing protein, partial [Bacteroidaceae bacterium]
CTGLTSINIPNSVTSLGNYCFADCTGLTSINIPNSVTNIGEGCFSGCTGLTSITIPNSVTSIGYRCFYSGTYPIYCCQNLYDQLKGEYGDRVILYDPTSIDETVGTGVGPKPIVGYYDLSGRPWHGSLQGLVVVRYADGTARTLYLK